MSKQLEKITEKAHEFLRHADMFYDIQSLYNVKLFAEAIQKGPYKVREKFVERDIQVATYPYQLAEQLLTGIKYTPQEIQAMIKRVKDFQKYKNFSELGIFLSVMIKKIIQPDQEILLNTGNNSQVHVSKFYRAEGLDDLKEIKDYLREEEPQGLERLERYLKEEDGYPLKQDQLKDYLREHLLISNLASKVDKGTIFVKGNVGNFFALENKGAKIQLDGECAWRACFGMKDGIVTINGTAGHELAAEAYSGKIYVNGNIRSIGALLPIAQNFEVYQNGKLLLKN